MKRVYTLYRVSTSQQVDVVKDDIPMQRIACRKFAEDMGWTIVVEKEEKGVSGFKVSATKRDAIQELKEAALNGEFDILLVFMFDRLGRIENETPFVLEWFAKHGIEVWSVNEGQQRFEQHVDKLMNYIRFWQASGESEKTSIRVKTRMHQMVSEGIYTGGPVSYGFMLVKKGRLNKKGQEMRDLAVNLEEQMIVDRMHDLVIEEG
ncbi:MAG: recombinase family protein [Clostridia bacterium]|nr:recombinase family protein [Clostridia bacterium]